MTVGDIIECHRGHRALILTVEKLYPNYPGSTAIRGLEVHWMDEPPSWYRRGINIPVQAVKRVVIRV
jgi:hypothetical protein